MTEDINKQKQILPACNRIFWEITIGLIIVVLLAGGLGAWRLAQGPVNLSFLLPYIQKSVNSQTDKRSVKVTDLNLEWDGESENKLAFRAQDVVVSNQRGPYLYIPELDFELSFFALLSGQVRFDTIWIRKVSLSITRTEKGDITLTGQDITEDQTVTEQEVIPKILTLNDIVEDLPVLSSFRLDEARVAFLDLKDNQTKIFDPLTAYIDFEETNQGRIASGFVTLPFGYDKATNVIKMNFHTQRDPKILNVNGRFEDTPIETLLQFTPGLPEGWDVNAVVSADFNAQLDNLWQLTALELDAEIPGGDLSIPLNGNDEKSEMVALSDGRAYIIVKADSGALEIKDMSVTLDKEALMTLSGSIHEFETPDNLRGDLSMTVSVLPQKWFERFWPKRKEGEKETGAERWLVRKVHDGVYSNLKADVDFDLNAPEKRNDGNPLPPVLKSVIVDFDFDEMTIDYRPPLLPAKRAKGTGQFKQGALSLNIDKAKIGDLSVQKGDLFFDDLITSGAGEATLSLPLKGPLKSVFDYIKKEPIGALKTADFDTVNVEGDIDAVAKIVFPMAKGTPIDDYKIDVTGNVTDLKLLKAVKNLTLAGGPYAVAATQSDIRVEGTGALAGKPITLDWHEYFSTPSKGDYTTKLKAQVTGNDAIRRAFINEWANYIKGDTVADVDYITDKSGKNSTVNLALDMTNATIERKDIGLKKSYGRKSQAVVSVHLQNGSLKRMDQMKMTGRSLSLTDGALNFITRGGEPFIKDGRLSNVSFDENKFNVNMGSVDNQLKINVSGEFLDARPFLEKEKDDEIVDTKQGKGRSREIGVNVKKMRTADTALINNVQLYSRSNPHGKIMQFEMDAKAGEGDLYVRYTPGPETNLSLQVEATDAGATLRAFDLYPYIQGGVLRIGGKPLSGGRYGDVAGKMRIDDFTLSKAPVLARLVNALSLPGILGMLEKKKLGFKRLESDFEWRIGEKGDFYTIENGTTSGASLGLTFAGTVDTAKQDINIKGTAAPLSGINKAIGSIPLIGSLLTGGSDGGIIAATYSVTGALDNPDVSVNPLSVLTPGILRRILFENDPTKEKKK